MANKFQRHLAIMDRSVKLGTRNGEQTNVIIAGGTYGATALELWQALTSADRLARWFLPVTGDLRQGGRYQFKGNASGTIEQCVEPELVRATWEFGGSVSWLTVRLIPQPDGTRLELEHEAPLMPSFTEVYGPGAGGVGWDGGFLGLGLYLEDPTAQKPGDQWHASEEGRSFYAASAEGWRAADEAAGTPPAIARERAENTRAFYTGEASGAAGVDGGS